MSTNQLPRTFLPPQGISDFRALCEGGYYYVDKSHFITELTALPAAILLIPRPRRFGKTLNMTTLMSWFERLPAGGTYAHLLDGLNVDLTPGKHHDKRGKLPVIFLSFKDIKETSWEGTFEKISSLIQGEVIRLSPWWESLALHPAIREQLDELRSGSASPALLSNSLKLLTQALAESSGQLPLLLVDEYDTPIQAGVESSFFKEVVGFFRNFLTAGLKDNRFLWKGVLTGILRVSKENLFSGLNNITVFSLTDIEFATCFGLREGEVEKLLSDAGLSERLEEVRDWYNGYLFGDERIYNPWSLISYVARPQQGCQPHWVNTASTALVGKAIADAEGILQRELEDLLNGGTIEKSIDDHISYYPEGIRPTDVWSFLLHTGYLTLAERPRPDRNGLPVAKLKIPNQEVYLAYRKLITEWIGTNLGGDTNALAMLQALATGNEPLFTRHFTRLVATVLSFHDVYPETTESFYHAFVTGMLVILSHTHYIRSNRESGFGRYDVMLEPHDKATYPGVIIEFKLAAKTELLGEILESAHKQIIDKQYATELRDKGCARIIQWGIVFSGKDVLVSVREG